MKTETIFVEESQKTYEILIGKNAIENDQIVRNADLNDIWFHFETISSPHIILKSGGDMIPKRYLNQVAKLLFLHKSNVQKQNVIYTEVKNVKLTRIPGSVITKNVKLIRF